MTKIVKISDATNAAKDIIETAVPFQASVMLEGASDFLFHRWNCDAVDAKAKAAKGSKAKKSDDIESYVYRCDNGELGIPGEYLRMALIGAAKFRQDPRSPRKSAQDLFKAAIVNLTPLATLGKMEWDYEDRRRVVVQRNGISRIRPAMRAGWRAEFMLQVMIAEYIDHNTLRETIEVAGRLIGLGDFRPTFGRFGIIRYEILPV